MSVISRRNGSERAGPSGDDWSSPETAGRVLTLLHANADDDGEAEASLRGIAAALTTGGRPRISPITARRALRRLIDHGQIELVRAGTGRDYPSRYRVLERAATSAA